jgi:plasmid stability protein
MAQVIIRQLDEEVVTRLKRRAASNGRSLEQELRDILIEAARLDWPALRQIADSIRSAGRPGPDSVDLLREDRDR